MRCFCCSAVACDKLCLHEQAAQGKLLLSHIFLQMPSSFQREGRSSAAETEAQSVMDPSPYLVPWGPGSGVILPPFTIAN
jgi:hypothetical protein